MTPHSSRSALMAALLLVSPLTAEEAALRDRLREALYTEEVSRDPEAAAKQYQALLAQHDEQRPFAATALFRLAEVRRKQDRKDEAIALYQRLIREFPGATAEVKLAGQNLVAMGAGMPAQPEAEPVVLQDDDSKELARLKGLADSAPDLLTDPQTLANAARQGWRHSVDYLLEKGSEPYAGGAFVAAAEAGYLDVCRRLIAKGGKPPATLMREVLSAAITKNRIEVIRGLLDETPDLPSMNLLGRSLVSQPQKWNRALSELILQKGANIDEMPASTTFQPGRFDPALVGAPLHVAISQENTDAAKWLIEKGAKPDLPTPDHGITPLHLAISQGNIPVVTLLLDAGADPNRASGQGNMSVSIGDNEIPLDIAIREGSEDLVKILMQRGAKPSEKSIEQKFYGVNAGLRSYLLRQFFYPEAAKKEVITSVWISSTSQDSLHEAARRENGEAPSLAEIVLAEFRNDLSLQLKSLTLLRAKPEGGFEERKIDLRANDPLPALAWGDILEIDASNGGIVQGGFTSKQMLWQLKRRRSIPVRFEVAGKEREVTLSGDRFVFNPADPKMPVLNAGALVGCLYPLGREVDGGAFTLRVVRPNWPEIRIGYPSGEANNFELQSGDRVILDLPADFQKAEVEARPDYVTVLCPTLPFRVGFRLDPLRGDREGDKPYPVTVPTLLQALAEVQSRSLPKNFGSSRPEQLPEMLATYGTGDLTVLPHPDYSRIRIRRLKAEGGEEVIPVDLAQAIEATRDDTPAEEARKADIELQPGDIVEVPVKEDRLAEPWKGMSKGEERLFAKALQARVQWIDGDGRITLQPISFTAVRYVETPVGWLPMVPPIGVPSLRGNWQGLTEGLTVTRSGVAYPSQAGSTGIAPNQVFLRDGDQLFRVGSRPSPRQARPSVPPPAQR